ncbi:MAG: amino acid adenylation domain-containing protein [Nostoc desertorum CM1-VF14]|jgi:amino acid adenylation domain-containing protein|nr:amino acid adenylation domain-containing protein [Nostoc desertorum CM1-VF14]
MQALSIEGFQISPQQKRLWLLQQEANHQPYRVQCAVLVEGNIKHSILEKAIHNVWDKYEILRTSFPTLAGMAVPLQVIEEEISIKFNYYDWQNLNTETQQINIDALFQEHNKFCFDLEKGFTSQIDVIKKSENQYLLLIKISTICADRITLHHLLHDISVTYNTYLQEHELEDTPLQYADIAAWQNELLIGEEAKIAKEYWLNQKVSNSLIYKLPNEKKVNQKPRFEPKVININFDSAITNNIAALAQKNNVDISVVLMACWQILLWRLTNKSEVVLALCCDGRNYQELQPAVGLLAKYLPIHIQPQEDNILFDILKQLDKQLNELYQWQDFFNSEEFFAENKDDHESSFLPFAFEFLSQPSQYFANNISFSIQKIYSCIERFKVKLLSWYQGDSLAAELYYDANLFEPKDIERLAVQFQTLLISLINNAETAIAQLEILSPQERQQLLVEFNNTKIVAPPYQCIHHWIEAQANKTPNNLAVVFDNQNLTYQELNTKANNLANHLTLLGVQPETVVGLCVERSLDMIVGILGILKAGAAYLPLEPSLPEAALTFRLQDAQVSVLLTQKHLVEKINFQAQVVCIDADINYSPQNNIIKSAKQENLAYVIYTSGSTGKPKGVAVEHRQIVNYVNGILEKLNLPEAASYAIVSTFAADLGNTAIYSALCTGGCLHIISQERATNPLVLAEYCDGLRPAVGDRNAIDCLKIVPSHLSALLASGYGKQILPRQRLILGGEACSWELIKQIQQHAPNCQIINHYGPTETTVGVLTYTVNTSNIASETVPLGRPLANIEIYLLDAYLQPVPIGVAGEIYIGGDSVARGYLNQPEATIEKFIHHPFSENPTARLYKTGDIARYHHDGNIEFIGRIDDQVKLHGFRIELGEIESVLRQYQQIQEAVVLVQEDEPGQKRLLAYIVPQQSELDLQELRNFLKQQLSEYMMPSIFIQLKALPLNSNGKIDRKALPAPDKIRPELEVAYTPPKNEVERIIAQIWQEILQVEKVGIYDNFFELGGHSLLIIQLTSKLQSAFKRSIPVTDIFKNPTIHYLADFITQGDSEQAFVDETKNRVAMRQQLMNRRKLS